MMEFLGSGLVGGQGRGPALVSRMPINFAAAFGRAANALPGQRSVINDRHHELYKKKIRGTVLIFPSCIGSTFTGMVLMQIMYKNEAPAAIVVHEADPLLVAGSVLSNTWFACGVPIVEYRDHDMFNLVRAGDILDVNGDTGKIVVHTVYK